MNTATNPMHELLWSGAVGLWELFYELVGLYQRFPSLIYPTLWLVAGVLGAIIYYAVVGCTCRDNCGRNQTSLIVFAGPLSLPFVLAGVWLACRKVKPVPKVEIPITPVLEPIHPDQFRRVGGA